MYEFLLSPAFLVGIIALYVGFVAGVVFASWTPQDDGGGEVIEIPDSPVSPREYADVSP